MMYLESVGRHFVCIEVLLSMSEEKRSCRDHSSTYTRRSHHQFIVGVLQALSSPIYEMCSGTGASEELIDTINLPSLQAM